MKHIFRKIVEAYLIDDETDDIAGHYCIIPIRNTTWCKRDGICETKLLSDIGINEDDNLTDGVYKLIQFTLYSSDYSRKDNIRHIVCGLKDSCRINGTLFAVTFDYFIEQFKVDLGILGISRRDLVKYINRHEGSDIWTLNYRELVENIIL